MAAQQRIYIGGLIPEITSNDVAGRFQPFGEVLSCEIIQSKAAGSDPNSCRGFAYVALQPKDEASLARMLSLYNGCKWRGQKLRVELAKPDYLAKLKQEWQADQELEQAAQQQQQEQEKQQEQQKQQAGPGSEDEDAHILRLTVPGLKKKTINVDLTAKSKSHRSWFPTHKMKRPHELDWEPLPPSKRAALQAAAEAAPPLQRAGAEQLQSFLERQQQIEAIQRKQQQQPADGPGAQGVAVPFSYTQAQQQQHEQQQQPAKKGLSQVVQQELWSQLKLLKRISEREQQHGHKNQAVVDFLDVGSTPGQQQGSARAADDALEAADGLLDTVLSRFDDSDSDGEGREILPQQGLLVAAARISKPVPQAAAAATPVVPGSGAALLPAGNQARLLNKQQQQQQISKQPKVQKGQQQPQDKQPSKVQQSQQPLLQHKVPKLPQQGGADSEGSSKMSSGLAASDAGDDGADSEYGSDQWEQWLAAEGIMADEDSSDGEAERPPLPAGAGSGSGAGATVRARVKAGVTAAAAAATAAAASARPSRGVDSGSGGQPVGGGRQQLSSNSEGGSRGDATSSDGSDADKGSLPQPQLFLKQQQQPRQQQQQRTLHQGSILKQQQGSPKPTKQDTPQVVRPAGKQAARAPATAAVRGLDAFDSDSEEVLVDVDDEDGDGAAAAAAVHSKQQRGRKHSGDMLLCPRMQPSGRRGV